MHYVYIFTQSESKLSCKSYYLLQIQMHSLLPTFVYVRIHGHISLYIIIYMYIYIYIYIYIYLCIIKRFRRLRRVKNRRARGGGGGGGRGGRIILSPPKVGNFSVCSKFGFVRFLGLFEVWVCSTPPTQSSSFAPLSASIYIVHLTIYNLLLIYFIT